MLHNLKKTLALLFAMGITALTATAQDAKPLNYTSVTESADFWSWLNNAFDGNISTKWYFSYEEEQNDYFKVDRPVQIKGYYITPDEYQDESPRSWIFYASQDEGQHWEVLHEVKADTLLYMNPLTEVYYPLKATTTAKYDHFKIVVTGNHDYGDWSMPMVSISEMRLDPAVCDAMGHRGELRMHQACDASCTEVGYTEVCYECTACGQFYKDRNGLRTLSSTPIILPSGHHFEGGHCHTCGLTDTRYQLLGTPNINISILDKGEPWIASTANVGGSEVNVLRSSNTPFVMPDPDEDGYYEYSYEYPSEITLHMSSEVPFTLSFRYRPLDVDLYGNHTGYYMYINNRDSYCNDPEGYIHRLHFNAGTYDFPISFTRNVYRPEEAVLEDLMDEFSRTAMIIWDVKAEAECTHNGYEQQRIKSVEANCITPAHDIYTCTHCNLEYSVNTGDTYALKHNSQLEAHNAEDAKCTTIGCTQYCYVCPDCMAVYADKEGKVPLASSVIINPLGHDYSSDMTCKRCNELQDRRIQEMQCDGVTVLFDDQDLEYPFTSRPESQKDADAYTIIDRYGQERTFPKNAIVSSNPEKTNGVSTFTVSSDHDFRMQFNYSMSIQSKYDQLGPIILSVKVDDEGVETYGYRYTEDWGDNEVEDFYIIDLKAGTHKVTMSMNLYGPEAQGMWGDQSAKGDDFGYIYNFKACAHAGAKTTPTKTATCYEPSETHFECSLCGFEKTIIGEIDPYNHALEGMYETPATCTSMGISSTYYYCDKCGSIKDEWLLYDLDEKPLVAALGHDYDEHGKCTRCGENNYYDGIPVKPSKVTLDLCDLYGLSTDYLDYYIISNAKELYGFAQMVNEQDMRDINAVVVSDIAVNQHILCSDEEMSGKEEQSYDRTDPEYFESPRADIDGKQRWTPLGKDEEHPYTGIFDGRGHTITGLCYTATDNIMAATMTGGDYGWYYDNYVSSDNIGLFGVVDEGTVREVKLSDTYFHGTKNVGGIAGRTKHAVIDGCEVNGYIRGQRYNVASTFSRYIGGLVGYCQNGSSISQCKTDCDVDGWWDIGGLVGYLNASNIVTCMQSGNVDTTYPDWHDYFPEDNFFGILVGTATKISGRKDYHIINTFTTEFTNYRTFLIGEGEEYPKIENMRHVNNVEMRHGEIAYALSQPLKLQDPVSEWDYYTDEDGDWGYKPLSYYTYKGDLWRQKLGQDEAPILDSSRPHVYYGVTSCTDETFIYSNHEILNAGHEYDEHGLCLKTAGEIHYQPCEVDEEGTHVISNYGQLYSFAQLVNEGQTSLNARLTGDIVANEALLDANGKLNAQYADTSKAIDEGRLLTWTPIADKAESYRGHFDGARFTIRGLYCDNPYGYASLFGQLHADGKVSALTVDSSYFHAYGYAASFAGLNKGTLLNCAATQNVVSTEKSLADGGVKGGLVAYQDGVISHCLTDADCLYGEKVSSASHIETSFFLSDTEGENSCTAQQLASGAICWILNDNQATNESFWGQTLESDPMPLLADTCKLVFYGHTSCSNNDAVNYTNTEVSAQQPGHYYKEGICVHCGVYQPATLATDGWYEVGNYGQLMWFAQEANAKSDKEHHYNMKLIANIIINKDDIAANIKSQPDYTPLRQWTPIGSTSRPFYGSINGQGHSISGLYCKADSLIGFIGYMEGHVDEHTKTIQRDSISHLTILDSYFTTDDTESHNGYVGAFVAMAKKGIVIYNCNAYGTVNGKNHNIIGGIAGQMSDSCIVQNCNNHAKISGYDNVGGIVGLTEGTEIVYCANKGTVSSKGSRLGGVAGYATKRAYIRYSYNAEKVSNTNSTSGAMINAGGIVGALEDGIVDNCYNTALVSVKADNVGGIAGQMRGLEDGNSTRISNCYTSKTPTGLIKSTSCIVPSNVHGEVVNCYSAIEGTSKYLTPVDGENRVTLQQLGSGELCYLLNNTNAQSGTVANKAKRRVAMVETNGANDEDTSIVTEPTIGDDISLDVVWRQQIGKDKNPTFSGPRVYYNKKIDEYLCLEDGDVNADKLIDIDDVTTIVDVILGKKTDDFGTSDVNGNNKVSIQDIILQIEKLKK